MSRPSASFALAAIVALAACERAATVPSPLDGFPTVPTDLAQSFASRLVDEMNDGKPEALDAALDLDTMFAQAIHTIALKPSARSQFVEGARSHLAKTGRSIGKGLTETIPGASLHLVRIRSRAGRATALVRVLGEDGAVNYLELVLGLAADGGVRVLDFHNYMSGQDFSETLKSIAMPLIAGANRSRLDKLLHGKDAGDDYMAFAQASPEITRLVVEGRHAEAMAKFDALPESVRRSRVALFLRMRVAQGLGDEAYVDALAAIERKFPRDPSVAFALIDRHFLKKDYRAALKAVARVTDHVGGDAYLDVLRATLHVSLGELEEARSAAQAAVDLEPTLNVAYWQLVTVALARKDHAETARLLDVIGEKFDLAWGDLGSLPEYADFVASPEYRAWVAAQE